MRYYSSSPIQRLVGGCFCLLAAAAAVYVAVRLIESVWPVLVGISVGVMALVGMVTALRRRRQGW